MAVTSDRVGSRLRILIIAEAANPEWVSVPLIGWSLANAIRQVADGHIVTQIRNRDAILRAGLVEGQDFTAIDTERLDRPMSKVAALLRMGKGRGWTMMTAFSALTYPYFERLVWKRFGADIQAGKFDIVHRITPLSPTAVSPLAAKCARAGVPFMIGPLNGGVPWPPGFESARRKEREWLSYVRVVYKLFPGRRKMLQSVRAILAGSRFTASEIPHIHQDKVFYLPENAIDLERFNLQSAQIITEPLRACFIGRLVPYKGPDMLLKAAAPFLRAGQLELDIIGDGPMLEGLCEQVESLGISQAVTMHGNLAHEGVQAIVSQANLLTFPSVREFGGGVVLEAMALGVVPLVMDYAGPGELAHEEFAFKVPIGTRHEIITAFSKKLEQIIDQPDMLPKMGQRARAWAQEHFSWQAKAQQVHSVYEWIMSPDMPRPEIIPEFDVNQTHNSPKNS